jgi:hypothetical protein
MIYLLITWNKTIQYTFIMKDQILFYLKEKNIICDGTNIIIKNNNNTINQIKL